LSCCSVHFEIFVAEFEALPQEDARTLVRVDLRFGRMGQGTDAARRHQWREPGVDITPLLPQVKVPTLVLAQTRSHTAQRTGDNAR
jgi:hypothetical protein